MSAKLEVVKTTTGNGLSPLPRPRGWPKFLPMQHFVRMGSEVNIAPLVDEIFGHGDPFAWFTGRQDKLPVQRESNSIPLRGLVKSRIRGRKRRDVLESRWTSTSRNFPVVARFIRDFAAAQGARLARAKIVRLLPGARVYPHIDRGEYYQAHDRYHLVLQSRGGSYLYAGGEEVWMQEGELWWFDNTQVHEARNESEHARVHLIFDLAPCHAALLALAARAR